MNIQVVYEKRTVLKEIIALLVLNVDTFFCTGTKVTLYNFIYLKKLHQPNDDRVHKLTFLIILENVLLLWPVINIVHWLKQFGFYDCSFQFIKQFVAFYFYSFALGDHTERNRANVGCNTLKPNAGFKLKIIKTNTRKCWINVIKTKIFSNSWIKTLNTYFEQYIRCTDCSTPVYIPAGKVPRSYRIWD